MSLESNSSRGPNCHGRSPLLIKPHWEAGHNLNFGGMHSFHSVLKLDQKYCLLTIACIGYMLWAQVSTCELVEKAECIKTHRIFGANHTCVGTTMIAKKARGPGNLTRAGLE